VAAVGWQPFCGPTPPPPPTSLALTIWGDEQRVGRSELAGNLQPQDAMRSLSDLGMGLEEARQTISNVVEQQAIMLAVNHTFWVTATVMFIASALVWLSPRPKAAPGMGPGAGGH
jgi:MFS transporter, DHA2 family, multidrug resistance protein